MVSQEVKAGSGALSGLLAPDLSTRWHVDAQRRRTALVIALAIFGTLVSAAGLVLLNSLAGFLAYGFLVLASIAWRPRIGLYLACGLALYFEYLTDDPMMLLGRYLYSGSGGSVVSPF